MDRPEIQYRQGLAVLRHVREADAPEWMAYDARVDALVAPGSRLPELRAWGAERGIGEPEESSERLSGPLFDPREPRAYQREALSRWTASAGRGSVVLPTGAGKTLVAILAIHQAGTGACVVAPTRALVAQWFSQLAVKHDSEGQLGLGI